MEGTDAAIERAGAIIADARMPKASTLDRSLTVEKSLNPTRHAF